MGKFISGFTFYSKFQMFTKFRKKCIELLHFSSMLSYVSRCITQITANGNLILMLLSECRILVPDYGFMHLELIPMLVGFFTYKIATFTQAIQEAVIVVDKKTEAWILALIIGIFCICISLNLLKNGEIIFYNLNMKSRAKTVLS